MIQSTRGMSKPRAATSVQRSVPVSALQNSKKVVVRFCCFCLPYECCVSRIAIEEECKQTYVKVEDGDSDDEKWEEIDAVDKESGDEDAADQEQNRRQAWGEQSKGRRTEALGWKKTEKEVYKKGQERKRMKAQGTQWSG